MDQVSFIKAIIAARVLQLYYHYCHNLVTGPTFLQDHEMFGGFYASVENDYDALVEYLIATLGNKAIETKAVNQLLMKQLTAIQVESMSAEDMFSKGLELEDELYSAIRILDAKGSIGVKNLIGDIAQKSDVRQYKVQQRLQ